MKNHSSDLNRSVLYFFIYWPLGTICPMIGQYLSSIGFSGTQVGIITSLGTGTAIVAGFFWGKIYSGVTKKRCVLMVMCLLAAFFGFLNTATTDFAIYAVIYSCMYFFQGPAHGIADALVLSKSNNYPIIRGAGAAGYAVASFVVGKYAQDRGLETIFYLYAAAFVIAAFLVMRESEPPSARQEESVKMKDLFKNKVFVRLLICAFFMTGTSIAHNTYFGYLFRQEGGSVAGIGTAFFLMAGSEAIVMAAASRFSKKIGTEKMLLFASIVLVARFAFYATGPSYKLLLGSFFLQGLSGGIILMEIVKYFNKIVEPRMTGMAISIYYALGNNFSVIVASLLGGIILDIAGPQGVYGFFAVFNSAAIVLYVALGMSKRRS